MSYHELGRVAQARQQLDKAEDWLDEAEDWYRKCLITKEELGDKRGLASTYHHLGIVAQICERPDEAEDWYRNSLTIEGSSKPAGDRPQLPTSLAWWPTCADG